MKDTLIEAVLKEQQTNEYEAFMKAVGERGVEFILTCRDIAGEELVDPVAKLMSKNNLQDQFARLVKVISMLSFHYGWQAKTEDSI